MTDRERDYIREGYYRRQHAARFARYVEANGLPCQACGGRGGEEETIDPWLGGPWYDCGWCEGNGLTTRWLRGLWLRCMRDEARARRRQQRSAA